MRLRNVLLPIAVMALLLIAWPVTGCGGGEKDTQGTDRVRTGDDSGGRIIVPDADWESAEEDEDDGEENGDEADDEEDVDEDEAEDTDEEESEEDGVILASTLEMRLFVDGVEHPMDEPLLLRNEQRVNCEFHLKATGSQLAYYQIRIPAEFPPPKEGELSGLEATVSYSFVYILAGWGEGGIVINVANREGSAWMKQVMVFPADDLSWPNR